MRVIEYAVAATARLGTWALLGPILTIACSDGPTAPGDVPGTFRATISGRIARTTSGAASGFGLDDEYRVEFFPNGDEGGASGFRLTVLGNGGRPPVGSYAIMPGPGASPQPPTVFASACVDPAQPCFPNWRVNAFRTDGTAGRLDITRSSIEGVAGSLEVDLDGDGNEFSGATLHVSARFNATWRR